MNPIAELADGLHRTAKLALDTGEAASVDDAESIFKGYRVHFELGAEINDRPALQAALLTAVNCAARTFLGGVTVSGEPGPLCVALPPFADLHSAVVGLGGQWVSSAEPGRPTLMFGTSNSVPTDQLAIQVSVSSWCGGVVPAGTSTCDGDGITPAGVLAGAIGVSELFQRLRGNPMACRRSMGMNLWRLGANWQAGDFGPELDRLPAAAWLIGLGNLGQAYLWTLGLLPYGEETAELVLQDDDVLAASNLSTSLLTTKKTIGMRKTRAMAHWAEQRGFRTTLVERQFADDFQVGPLDPVVALVGVDNALARQAIESVGFERVIEAGLGQGARDFLGVAVHTFPASKPAREVWRDIAGPKVDIELPAYQKLHSVTGDRCGTVQIAGRSVAAPFVGGTAAALVVAELLRLGLGSDRYELTSCHLRDLGARVVVNGAAWPPCSPGSSDASGKKIAG